MSWDGWSLADSRICIPVALIIRKVPISNKAVDIDEAAVSGLCRVAATKSMSEKANLSVKIHASSMSFSHVH